MVDLPADNAGLGWIVDQDSTKLLLIPGLQPAAIVAAAEGDQQALAYLRFTAQHYAAYPGGCIQNALDRACLAAASCDDDNEYNEFLTVLQEDNAQVANVFKTRQRFTVDQLYEATQTGQLAALMWMQAICPQTWPVLNATLLLDAAGAGQLHIVKYLRSGPDPAYWDDEVSGAAVEHLDCLKWLLSADAPGGPCPYYIDILCNVADAHGLPALEWFHANGSLPEDVWSLLPEKAAARGDQQMLAWTRAEPRIPWNSQVCDAAASKGNISLLRWLRSQSPPCPWGEGTTAVAARNDLQTLQWLRAQDPPCPWARSACTAAVNSGNLETLAWIRAQDPPCPWDDWCFKQAACRSNVEALQWLHDRGCPFLPSSIDLSAVAYCGHLPTLKWLCDHGCMLTGRLYIHAAHYDRTHILMFLHRMKTPLPDTGISGFVVSHCTSVCTLMVLSDIGMRLGEEERHQVTEARRAYCALHGLVRWYRRAILDPSRGAHQAFDSLAEDRAGQLLLYRLCLLPPELISKIAIAAGLHHGLTLSR